MLKQNSKNEIAQKYYLEQEMHTVRDETSRMRGFSI